MASFKASARRLDNGMGKVFQAIDDADLTERTLIICTTDHGIAFPHMKCNLTDHGIGVMLIMRGLGFHGGKVLDSMVSQIDIFPTLCELLEIDIPAWVQGVSFLPLTHETSVEIREELCAEVTYHAAYEPQRCIRTKRYKYIRRYENKSGPVLPNCDDSPSKDVWMNNGWRSCAVEREQLYDLVFDPNETANRANDPTLNSILSDMQRRLDNWMSRTEDPLLCGPIQAPVGAQINDPDGISPQDPCRSVLRRK